LKTVSTPVPLNGAFLNPVLKSVLDVRKVDEDMLRSLSDRRTVTDEAF
jgi:hypothetical protein